MRVSPGTAPRLQIVNGTATPACVAARQAMDITPESGVPRPEAPAPPPLSAWGDADPPPVDVDDPPAEQARRIELAAQVVALNMAFYEIQRAGTKPDDADSTVPQVWRPLPVSLLS